jgi:type I restriction enzyme S subunit
MKQYSSYKDSGIEWIGEIPSHWEVKRVGSVFSQRNEVVSDTDYQPLSVTKNGIVPQMEGVAKTDNNDNRKLVMIGDYVINSRSDRKGSSGLSYLDGSVSVINIVLNPFGINPKITPYMFKSYDFIEEFFRNGKGIVWDLWSTRFNEMKNILLPLPPLSEQDDIVSYLDDKTTKIDELIQKKLRKIDLLKEYRTSLINTVVTKGLHSNVPMKDSGIEWIGEIPSHWEVKKLKYVSEIIPSNVDKHIFPDEIQVSLCNYTDVYKNEKIDLQYEFSKGSCNHNEKDKYQLRKNDVIITKDSETPDDIGVPCLITEDLDNVICGYHLTMLRPIELEGGFLFRYLQSNFTKSYFCISSNGMTRYGLGKSSIEDLITLSPPLSEQEQIVSYLDEKTSQIDKTIDIEKKKIELLKEYRQSLISNVVTGKIKVIE